MDNNNNEKGMIAQLIERARTAQTVAQGYSQEKVDILAAAIAYTLSRSELAQRIAELAYEETGMGLIESKYGKLAMKIPAVFFSIKDEKTVGVVEEIKEKNLIRLAKPVGVIGALIPCTNPEGTPVFNAICGIRGRNALIFAPHPRSKRTTIEVVNAMREVLKKNDAPEDLLICIKEPSKGVAQELMTQCDLIMATGSGDMVKAAYSSGKPAYGVGAGNAPIIVDNTVDLSEAAEKIRIGKTGDNASGCSAENSLLIQEVIYPKLLEELKKQGGYLLTEQEKQALQKTMWPNGQISIDIVAKPAAHIAALAGIQVPEETRFLMVEETGVGKEYPFSAEKMSLVLTLYKWREFAEAIGLVNKITRHSGYGHSCGIHSNDKERILQLALQTSTARVTVRQPHGVGNGGNWINGLAPTFSLGCGTWGGGIASENITQKHFLNTTLVSMPLDITIPDDDAIFGAYLSKIKTIGGTVK